MLFELEHDCHQEPAEKERTYWVTIHKANLEILFKF
jgi:hypothetical protein